MKKRLFIFVEGEDDIRFFGRIVKPLFVSRYDAVEIIPYAGLKRQKVNNLLISIIKMKSDYILAADIDQERSVRDKKQVLYGWFSNISGGNIVVVIREIESWYYAGLSEGNAAAMGVPPLVSTDDLTKEDFNALIPPRFDSRIDLMFEILKSFSPETAVQHNQSFRFFMDRYHLLPPGE